ncbi:MAG: nicotinate-nucleotide adenylyltransferase [Bacteroidaceae bacterium]|nr:nicotinate-nucleotide adenylyltransferase [Bacteroidaceae bacterium]
MKLRTGIYGGSFNPIHRGHTTLGRALCDMGWVDELWFLVSPLNPFKQNATDLLADEARLELTRLAVEGDTRLQVCDAEMHLPRPSYMVATLEFLRQQYPDREFVLVIGADNWARFMHWKQPEEILRHHHVVIYPRPGYPIDGQTLPPRVHLAETPLIDVSSTAIRRRIASGDYHGEDIGAAVWEEIQRRGYYQSEARE